MRVLLTVLKKNWAFMLCLFAAGDALGLYVHFLLLHTWGKAAVYGGMVLVNVYCALVCKGKKPWPWSAPKSS